MVDENKNPILKFLGMFLGIPGLYVTEDPGAHEHAAKTGNLSLRIGLGWAKSISFGTGQCPVCHSSRHSSL
jgi:glutathione-independent formaldehyde dehydrogenase